MLPSPKVHAQEVADPKRLAEVSVKFTFKGPLPLVGLALNPALGAGSVTDITLIAVLTPKFVVTISLAVYVVGAATLP